MLWVPPKVSRELADEAVADTAHIERAALALGQELDHWTREVKQIDDRLEVRWVGPDADAIGLIPNRYHVIRFNDPPTPPTVIPVVGPDDEYRPLDSGVLEMLRASDLWDDRAQRDRREAQEQITRAQERTRARVREERREELRDRVNAAWRTSVSMTDAAPWSQNTDGRRGAGDKR